MNKLILDNYSKLKLLLFLFPTVFLLNIAFILYSLDALSVQGYIQIQKDSFFFINYYLESYPVLLCNLTQFGDALIFLSFLPLFILYAPKVWEALITGSIFSLLFSVLIKETFAIPRPAAVFDYTTFNIIGERLSGSNSFPSGHSITIFTVLTVLMFAFMPKNRNYKIIYFALAVSLGLLFAFTRVAVGAHYPLDVIIGCIFGYVSGLLGTFISRKYKIWGWIYDKTFYPYFVILLLVCGAFVLDRIVHENLLIYYLSLISLLISISKITLVYVKK